MKTSPKFARLIKRIGKSLLILAILLATQSSLPVFLAGTANQAGNFYQAAAAGDPVIAAAGDIACDPSNSIFNNGQGNSNACRALYTSNLLVNAGLAAVLDLGDNQYYCGGYQAFLQSYDLSWGRVKSITHPSVGNHEYLTSGGTDCNAANTNAAGYFQYFGSAAGTQGQGWYSFNVGSWHLIALNSNCSNAGGCGTTSAQYKFLQADLAAHPNQCTLAYWHIPLYSSGGRSAANSKPFWTLLYNAHADIILNGHDHIYERFAPQDPNAGVDATNGIREFIVGTGGSDHTTVTTVAANSLVRNPSTFGVLKLTLHAGSYDWAFVPEAGKTFTDSGSANCHASGSSNPTPTPTATVALTNTPTSTPTGTLAATNTPTLTPTGTLVATNTPTTTPNSGGSTVIILPVVDTYVNGGSTTTNYGNSTTLRLDASPDLHGLLRFNISGLGGASISQALLSFYPRNSDSQGIRAWAVSNNTWGELTTNYTNAPPLGGQLASTGSFPAGIRINMNVTAYVTGEGSYSFGVTNISSTAISVDSREAGATAPQLILTLNGSSGPTATPTATLAATNTPTPTATGTLAVTNTPTQTPTSTATLVVTNTPTPPPTGTLAATNTPTSTPTTGAGQSLTFTSQSDTYVDSSTPTVNNGTRTTLRADASPIVNSYLRFGVSGLSGTVTSVHLLIFANSSLGSGLKALAVADTTWGETSMTYNNAPALGSVLATAGSITSGTWVNLDVTGYISADGTYSFGITSSNATTISLASRESGANAPQLVITTQ